jgi:hypothetical protein
MTSGFESRTNDFRSRDESRGERGGDRGFNQFMMGGMTPVQPSLLGFMMNKQEMPHHLSILFRAR